jgi:hypothetical protein
MNVCSNCFNETELKAYISASGTTGSCDVCEGESAKILPLNELMDFFTELIQNFVPREDGLSMLEHLQNEWDFFSRPQTGKAILDEVLGQIKGLILSSETRVDFSADILENVGYWAVLKDEIKWSKRFLTNIEHLTENRLGWDSFFWKQFYLQKNVSLYRARIHPSADLDAYPPDQMSAPSREVVGNGRANPIGIPFLYLSTDEETPLYEVRATLLDDVSVGEFRLKEGVEEIKIVDFIVANPLFSADETSIADAIKSKPMRKYDSELEYIPTQFICEFIKTYTGAHGIQFESSVKQGGKNIVVFDSEHMECVNVQVKTVLRVHLTAKNRIL